MVTHENNPDLWQRLHNLWLEEQKPGYVLSSGVTYMVLDNAATHEKQFKPLSNQSMYESVGF